MSILDLNKGVTPKL